MLYENSIFYIINNTTQHLDLCVIYYISKSIFQDSTSTNIDLQFT